MKANNIMANWGKKKHFLNIFVQQKRNDVTEQVFSFPWQHIQHR